MGFGDMFSGKTDREAAENRVLAWKTKQNANRAGDSEWKRQKGQNWYYWSNKEQIFPLNVTIRL